MAKEIGCSASQVALSWVQQQSPMLIPVVGCRKLTQLTDNMGCVDVTLSAEHVARLHEVSKIELGFPYDFIKGGRTSWLGAVVEQVDDHRNTVV